MRSIPAILGGEPSVRSPAPHYAWPSLSSEEESAVLAVMRRGEISLHRRSGIVQEFEDAFAEMHGGLHVMSTCSGTAALHAAYFGLDLTPGDEVIVPAYTHLGTALPMLHVGLVPVLCDVDAGTGNIDPAQLHRLITPRTGAITVTHQYGHVCHMDEIVQVADRFGLRVIEDCSHAHGATYKGRLAGMFGDVSCFSLQSHKAVAAGEGGVLLTRDPRIFERAALLGHFRQRRKTTSREYEPFAETGYGLKNRLHPLAAAIALEQLKKLPEVNRKRAAHLARFNQLAKEIPGVAPLPTSPEVIRGGFFRFLLHYVPEELGGLRIQDYVTALKAEGVVEVMLGALAKPLHLTRIMQTLDDHMYANGWPRKGGHVGEPPIYRPGSFPNAERFSAHTLQFPAFTHEPPTIVAEYCRAMAKLADHRDALSSYFARRSVV